MNKIICIGNRLIPEDSAGLDVYDLLRCRELPARVELVEGGLAGLDLLVHLESGGRIVFVDSISGFGPSGRVVVLPGDELLEQTVFTGYGHDAGLPYLLAMLPHVCEGKVPDEIFIVGLEGSCTDDVKVEAAECSLHLAVNGCCAI